MTRVRPPDLRPAPAAYASPLPSPTSTAVAATSCALSELYPCMLRRYSCAACSCKAVRGGGEAARGVSRRWSAARGQAVGRQSDHRHLACAKRHTHLRTFALCTQGAVPATCLADHHGGVAAAVHHRPRRHRLQVGCRLLAAFAQRRAAHESVRGPGRAAHEGVCFGVCGGGKKERWGGADVRAS